MCARVLLDAFRINASGLACVPGPGLPVRIQGEDPAGGGGCGDGLRLSGQAGRGMLVGLRVLAVLEGVDLSLPVHRQQEVIVQADAGEPGVLAGVKDGGSCLSAVPGVYLLVGSECGLPVAAGRNLQVVEPVGCLGGGGDWFGRAVLRPGVDPPVAGQADYLVSCGVDAGELRFLPVGRADGQPCAGGGPVIRVQPPVRGLGPLCFQGGVLEDGGLQVEGLAVKRPSVEPEALTLRVLLRGIGERAGFHGRLGGLAAVGRVEAHCVRSLTIRLFGWLGRSGVCAAGCSCRR